MAIDNRTDMFYDGNIKELMCIDTHIKVPREVLAPWGLFPIMGMVQANC